MNRVEFNSLANVIDFNNMINADTLADIPDGVLIYGYTCERDTFVLIKEKDKFIRHIYSFKKETRSKSTVNWLSVDDCVPDKRVYPHYCNYEFCKFLKSKGQDVPFTTFEEDRVGHYLYDSEYYATDFISAA